MRIGTVIAMAAACAALAGTACRGKGDDTTPAPPPDDGAATGGAPAVDAALMREIAAGLEEVLATMAAITTEATDCPAMATQLGDLFDKSQSLFDLAHTQAQDPAANNALAAELDKRAPAVQPLVERISKGLERCKLDADVAAAMERMPTL